MPMNAMKVTPVILAIAALVSTSCVITKGSGGTTTYKADPGFWGVVADAAVQRYAPAPGKVGVVETPAPEVIDDK